MVISRATLTVFTPSAVPGDELRRFTVGRHHELSVLTRALAEAASSKSRPHVLLVGPRGSGKSHLLALAVHHARTEELGGPVKLAWLPEDSYTITSYEDLLIEIVDQVTGARPSAFTPAPTLEQTVVEISRGEGVVVLIAENLNRLMSAVGRDGQHALRAFLHNEQAVLLLASTPSLFEGVTKHSEPFYGAFREVMLAELPSAEGRELLLRLAQLEGDDRLGAYLASPTGLARLRAIEHLSGGSPRLWMLLASCVTVELLDDLVPLFLKLLDGLSAYYKARMDELPPGKAKIVAALCRVKQGAPLTVTEVAESIGSTPQVVSKLLHELERERYVVGRKFAGTDQRSTYYELREPLLRHWFELKATHGRPLTVIVEILRGWYEAAALRTMLGRADAGSLTERYSRAALHDSFNPEPVDRGYASAVPDDLLVEARRRLEDPEHAPAAAIVEAVVIAALHGPERASATYLKRMPSLGGDADAALAPVAPALAAAAAAVGPEGIKCGLLAACDLAGGGPTYLALAAAGWSMGWDSDFATAAGLLGPLWDEADKITDRAFALSIGAEYGFALAELGDRRGPTLIAEVLAEREVLLGPDHPDTLTSRGNHAYQTGETGDHTTARDLYQQLITDHTRILGPDHPNTLNSLQRRIHFLEEIGEVAECLVELIIRQRDSEGSIDLRVPIGSALLRLGELLPGARDAEIEGLIERYRDEWLSILGLAIGAAVGSESAFAARGVAWARALTATGALPAQFLLGVSMSSPDRADRLRVVLDELGDGDAPFDSIVAAALGILDGDESMLAGMTVEHRALAQSLATGALAG